ncbi:hypothetical protein BJ166DRAFT_271862 [Pestalotiopsis sp. NC0098]|nr:hypothetical protein BJ166DRAFT_271862 [Pestalotiopsis sp. NC0098]
MSALAFPFWAPWDGVLAYTPTHRSRSLFLFLGANPHNLHICATPPASLARPCKVLEVLAWHKGRRCVLPLSALLLTSRRLAPFAAQYMSAHNGGKYHVRTHVRVLARRQFCCRCFPRFWPPY